MENNQIQIALPISGILVTMKTRLTWDEKNEVEGVLAAATTTTVIDGVPTQTVDGSSGQKFLRKLIEAFVIRAELPTGEEYQINLKLGSLDAEDGDVLQEKASELYNAIKKKQVKTV